MDVVSVSVECLDVAPDSQGGDAPEGALVQTGTHASVRAEDLKKREWLAWAYLLTDCLATVLSTDLIN